MDYFYAQLDQDGVCVGISQLAGEVAAARVVALRAFEVDLIGRKYINDQWSGEAETTSAGKDEEEPDQIDESGGDGFEQAGTGNGIL